MEKVCVVIPVWNELDIVDQLVERLRLATEPVPYQFEFLLVDDGSTDGTFERLLLLQQDEPRLTVVRLSRNWGHQNAYNAGLDHVGDSDAIIMMDGGLQDPPELIPEFLKKWKEGFNVVYTVKELRTDGLIRKILTFLYYWIIDLIGEVKIEKNAGMFSLIDRKVCDQLRFIKEKSKSYPNLRTFVGFRQTSISFQRPGRVAGKPRQTLGRLLNDGLNAIFSFSFAPIRMITVVGLVMIVIFLVAFIGVLIIRIWGIEFGIVRSIPGWTSAILLILIVSSINLVFLGIIGEYIARIFDEVRSRPYYLVEGVYKAEDRVEAHE